MTPDISITLFYTFYQSAVYATHDPHFSSESGGHHAFWVGFAGHCGDSLTHMVLDADNMKFIYRSAIMPRKLKNPNKRLDDAGGEEYHQPHSKTFKHPTSTSDGDKPTQPDIQTVFIKLCKLFIIAVAELEELEGFILIFNNLKSRGQRCAERFYDVIKDMGFMPSKADPCVWMRENTNLKCYEYIATYVDGLCVAAQDPGKIIHIPNQDCKLNIKGEGPLSYHLGADCTRDKDKILGCQPKKYIDGLLESHQPMFKQDPQKMRTPLDKNDHPELDGTELLTGEPIQHYLTMIGQLQWLVTLGRFDIHAQVTTMPRFRSAPRKDI